MKSGFDRLAAPYRWMEYLSFGRALERCRLRYLGDLTESRNALLLGDGDGRFAARLLLAAPAARVHAVDASAAMLAALQHRCDAVGAGSRMVLHHADLTQGVSCLEEQSFDLVATHFFLDCLTDKQVAGLVAAVRPHLQPGARWIVSEFHIPRGVIRLPARVLVGALYAAFRCLTGLRVRHLPDHAKAFQQNGFKRVRHATALRGLLLSEVWVLRDS